MVDCLLGGCRKSGLMEVGVIERQAADLDILEGHALGCQLDGFLQQQAIEGCLAQIAAKRPDLDRLGHEFLPQPSCGEFMPLTGPAVMRQKPAPVARWAPAQCSVN